MDAIAKFVTNFSDCSKNNIVFIAIAVYLLMVFSFMSNNPDVLYSRQYFYLSIIIIPLAAVGIWFYTRFIATTASVPSRYEFIFAAIMLGLTSLGIYLYISKDVSILEIKSAFTIFRFLEVLIVLVILAIVFRTTIKKIDTSESAGWSGFFIQMIFYIPCLIGDFIEYFIGEVKATPKVVFSLFIVEILLILSYLYLPKILSASMTKNGIVLVKDPKPINMKKSLKTYMDLIGTSTQSNDLLKTQLIIKNKFSLSGWVYIVSQPPNK
jgi:hypothetical protein